MSNQTPRQIVEVFHLLFLKHLESKLDKSLYALKGGCNLRFFFKSIRYSEDIDLDVKTVAVTTLKKKVDKILSDAHFRGTLQTKGIVISQVSSPKQTATTQRWKLKLVVENLGLQIPTKIEFSRRKFEDNLEFSPVDSQIIQSYQLYPILLSHYSRDQALLQKCDALIHRSQTQARDVFDMKLLVDGKVEKKKIAPELCKKIEAIKEKIFLIGFDDFYSQVVAFLVPEYQDYYGEKKVWLNLQSELVQSLEGIANG